MRAWGSWDDADLWGEAWDSRPDTWEEDLDAAAGRPPRGQSGPGQWVGNLHGGWNMSAAARAYQEQITGVSAAYDYRVTRENRHADFDGYDRRQRVLLEAKAFGPDSGIVRAYQLSQQGRPIPPELTERLDALVRQARRQLAVAGDTGIEWHVASRQAKAAVQQLLRTNNMGNITVRHTAPNRQVAQLMRARR